MPGLVGFTAKGDRDACLRLLKAMQELIMHHTFYTCDKLWTNNWFFATRSHINISQNDPQPYTGQGFQVWLDGEFYNQSEIGQSLDCGNSTDPQLMAELFLENKHDSGFHFLRQINGIYSSVVLDEQCQKLYLVTDRYGLRHIYWTVLDGQLAWASEYKAFLALPDFKPRIDEQTVADFFKFGYCCEDRTWFEDVQVLSSGSVLIWDLKHGTWHKERYWGWDQIHPMTGSVDEGEVVEELGRLFRQAVERCCRPGERVGVQLSGGLDSRAILAAIPERNELIHAFTYGKQGCEDIRFASRAAKVRDAVHHVAYMNAGNWLQDRFNTVWWLDGQKNLLHMHALHALRSLPDYCDVHLSGYLGGITVGGSYLNREDQDEFQVVESRGRRFIWGGLRIGSMFIEERPVFFDNDFISFALSVPKPMRRDSYLYIRMLLSRYPDYFRHIPWQRTGYPISWPPGLVKPLARVRRFRYKLSHRLGIYDVKFPDRSTYTNYDVWIRQEPARPTFSTLLFDRKALYPEYVDRDQVRYLWQQERARLDWANQVCKYVTFELWLRQVFKNEFRPQNVY